MNSVKMLKNNDDLEVLVDTSFAKPVLIFKHSATCGTSHAAHAELIKFQKSAPAGLETAVIVVQSARDMSNQVARRLGVTHHSPQALLLRNGKVVWHKSHHAITSQSLHEAVGQEHQSAE